MKILFHCYRRKNLLTVEETIFIEYCTLWNVSFAWLWGYLFFYLTYAKNGWILNRILIFRK